MTSIYEQKWDSLTEEERVKVSGKLSHYKPEKLIERYRDCENCNYKGGRFIIIKKSSAKLPALITLIIFVVYSSFAKLLSVLQLELSDIFKNFNAFINLIPSEFFFRSCIWPTITNWQIYIIPLGIYFYRRFFKFDGYTDKFKLQCPSCEYRFDEFIGMNFFDLFPFFRKRT